MRPLNVDKPQELVLVSAPPLPSLPTGHGAIMIGRRGGKATGMDYPLATALRDGLADVFSAVAVRRDGRFTLAADTAIEVRGEFVNAGYFTVFGLRTVVGRTFTAAETAGRDGPAVVVLNHGFWMRQFGGDRSNHRPYHPPEQRAHQRHRRAHARLFGHKRWRHPRALSAARHG